MAIDAVLLDVDGTLVDSNEAHARAWSLACAQLGFCVPEEELRRWIGMGGDKILRCIDRTLSEREEPGASISRQQRTLFRACVPHLRPMSGARALLLHLRLRGIVRVIATSAKKSELEPLLETAGVLDEYDGVTTSDDAEASKPDADIVEQALAKANVAPTKALYLGDTPYDIEAARRAGVATIAVRCGGWDDAALRDAAAIYDDPADLLAHVNSSPLVGGAA